MDRDGVLNVERGTYTFRIEDFVIPTGVPKALRELKAAGYCLIVVTNQGGINKKLYTRNAVKACHAYLQAQCGNLLDALYYSPYHDAFTQSLSRKPNTLMIEKAIAKFNINTKHSWLVGDSERDIQAGHQMQVQTALVTSNVQSTAANWVVESLYAFSQRLLQQQAPN